MDETPDLVVFGMITIREYQQKKWHNLLTARLNKPITTKSLNMAEEGLSMNFRNRIVFSLTSKPMK
jgi:hypothetical protein